MDVTQLFPIVAQIYVDITQLVADAVQSEKKNLAVGVQLDLWHSWSAGSIANGLACQIKKCTNPPPHAPTAHQSSPYIPPPVALIHQTDLALVSGMPCVGTRERTSLPNAARCKPHRPPDTTRSCQMLFFANTCNALVESGHDLGCSCPGGSLRGKKKCSRRAVLQKDCV